ncbi:uncharacterized protein A1O9_08489 [Exophiala aquamarina CBS 119918]|uniref:Uncharacterized protein n=1 Tax=Exophiala aquamarina CBS 119918 TaxID=1182545 RepID=A0A072P6L1_9EURO|nr:uncharacterized protein A1O9_08489 [Exophiala aquamarina CBS 119918]KEF55739.1 hypothetical protein A1O9_08489 [Exophiala aquamarina CBS 119918]
MALVAFFAGRRIINVTKLKNQKLMPTPHQVSILISLLSGSGIRPLWDTLNWFGVATQPATVDILTASNQTFAYGRELNSNICSSLWHQLPCIGDSSSTCDYPCSITDWNASTGAERFGLQHAQEAAEVLMNNSYTNFVINVTAGSYDSQHYFLGDKRSSSSQDFTTDTFAVTTQCRIITQNCNGTGFTCGNYTAPSFAWSGAVGVDPTSATGPANQSTSGIQFFNDSALISPVSSNASKGLFTSIYPAPFLMWSKGFPLSTPQQTNLATCATIIILAMMNQVIRSLC